MSVSVDDVLRGADMSALEAADWVIVACCGAWKDDRIRRVFDDRFGPGAWRTGYRWGTQILSYRAGIQLYEDAYVEVLRNDDELREWLLDTASDVYDTAVSNVHSKYDYSVQEVEGAAQHWQDISLRRALCRLGLQFRGDHLVEIRGHNSEGYRLNPGQVPFHLPEMISLPRELGTWWKPLSIEDFSISNVVIQVPLERAKEWIAATGPTQETLRAILLAQDARLEPEMTQFEAAGPRATLFIRRARELMGGRVENDMVDALLCDDPAIRRRAIDQLEPTDMELLEAAKQDPARKNRNAATAIAISRAE